LPAEARKREGGTGRHLLTGVLILLLSSVVPSLAQGSRKNPYQKLFQPRDLNDVARAQQRDNARPATEPRVVCGMKVIPVDPNIDPKIFIQREPDDTRYTMRSIAPSICK
jgi:hypothetical protein